MEPVTPAAHTIHIGTRVEFAPNPRWPSRRVKGTVIRFRKDPRGGLMGWLDIDCDDGKERSARPNACRHAL